MYILSFDPAQINMSYCLIEIGTVKIKEWKLFSVNNFSDFESNVKHLKQYDIEKVLYEAPMMKAYNRIMSIKICGYIEAYWGYDKVKACSKSSINYMKNLNKEKLTYRQRKDLAIEKAYLSLESDKEWLDFFNNNRKKDDLADSYIQGLYYLSRTRTIGKV